MHISNEHIQEWIRSGRATVMPSDAGAGFGTFLNTLPWSAGGSRLDWAMIDGVEANLSVLTGAQLVAWLRSTSLGGDPYLVFWFAPDEACIACKSDFAITNIDQAFWKAPGIRYLFGASFDQGAFCPAFNHFAEYDGADSLVAAR
jgi:hypothetical protein